MRFLLKLVVDKSVFGNTLPLNYQYELSSFVYSTIERSDAKYSEWLHSNWNMLDKKSFRLFSFSNLTIPV
ncbi:MAG: CRISPR-associated endoribonuclease Cas6, partial [Paludibacter sp.]|nr:CRISPR-associated endoribonuclease Cas6 [Paludibacter sp.]